jgi:hypothetical protein
MAVIDPHDVIVTVAWAVVAVCAVQAALVYGVTRLFLHGPMFKAKQEREREHTYEPIQGEFGGRTR